MGIEEHVHLIDYAALDANGDGALSAEESLAMYTPQTQPTTAAEYRAEVSPLTMVLALQCAERSNPDGSTAWDGANPARASLPDTIDVDYSARLAARHALRDQFPPQQHEYIDHLHNLARNPGSLNQFAQMQPDLFGGTENFETLRAAYFAARDEAIPVIEAWQQAQREALPGGITLADGPAMCGHLEDELGKLDAGYEALTRERGASTPAR